MFMFIIFTCVVSLSSFTSSFFLFVFDLISVITLFFWNSLVLTVILAPSWHKVQVVEGEQKAI